MSSGTLKCPDWTLSPFCNLYSCKKENVRPVQPSSCGTDGPYRGRFWLATFTSCTTQKYFYGPIDLRLSHALRIRWSPYRGREVQWEAAHFLYTLQLRRSTMGPLYPIICIRAIRPQAPREYSYLFHASDYLLPFSLSVSSMRIPSRPIR